MKFLEEHMKVVLIIVTILLMVTIVMFRNKSEALFIESGIAYVMTPVQKYFGGVGQWFTDRAEFVKNIGRLDQENQILQKQIAELAYENKILKQYEKENERLRSLLDLNKKYPEYPMVGAEIIGKDPGNWYHTFIIDKGSNNGLEADMMVLADGGLVGRIVEVGKTYSKVISIIDDRSSVSVKVLRTDDLGIVKGDYTLMNDSLCKMEYIDAEAELIIGDEVVTSSLGDIYPASVMIGTIRDIKTESHGLTKYALVQPTVNFKYLEQVVVVNKKFKDLKVRLEE